MDTNHLRHSKGSPASLGGKFAPGKHDEPDIELDHGAPVRQTAPCPCGDGPTDPSLLRVVHGVAYCNDIWRHTGDPTHAQRAMGACRRGDSDNFYYPPPTGEVDEYGDQVCDCF